MKLNPQAIPLSLYIHLPWCVRKCPYCDFNSHALRKTLPEAEYVTALAADLAQDMALTNHRILTSIFFGGGTPSLFSGTAIARILKNVQQQLAFSDNIEITLEANPGTVEQQRFHDYAAAGVNRLSIGVQSFAPEKLKALGRIHSSADAKQAVATARTAGFTNFNLDLMYGLPEQTVAEALEDLQQAIALEPTHISWYQLTLEPNTLFHAKPPTLPDEEIIWEMQQAGVGLLAQHGYQQYEISAYAQPGKQAQHNLNYWLFGDYAGIGAGAHSKLTQTSGEIVRQWKLKNPKDYLTLDKKFIGEQNIVSLQELPFEFMLNALRLNQAISFELFEQRTGLERAVIMPALQRLANKELLVITDQGFQKTALGQRFLDNLTQEFLD